MKKDLVPRVIKNGGTLYFGFIHENTKKPRIYYDFFTEFSFGNVIKEAASIQDDTVEKITMETYFKLSDTLMRHGKKYNLNKKRYEYNNKRHH